MAQDARWRILVAMSPIALRIRELRERAGLSQAQLAEKAGVRQATVSELESGKGRRLLVVLDKLARALNTPPGELLARAPAKAAARAARKPRRSRKP